MAKITSAFLLSIIFPALLMAEIYKWVDEDGKVHYGDNPEAQEESYESIETVEIRDKFSAAPVEIKRPIAYEGAQRSHPISVETFSYENFANDERIFVGNVGYGIGCSNHEPIYVDHHKLHSNDAILLDVIKNNFRQNGYQADVQMGSIGGAYLLKPDIQKFKTDICVIKRRKPSGGSQEEFKVSQYVKIRWDLVDDTQDRTLYSTVTEGTFHGSDFKTTKKFEFKDMDFKNTFEMATNHLLADKKFLRYLRAIDLRKQALSLKNEPLALDFRYGLGKTSFNTEVDAINASAVTIEKDDSHGSGVIISPDGYVLTNAHVVGSEVTVKVMVNGKSHDANVVRSHPIRDVALLKIKSDASFSTSDISKSQSHVGDDIFVIGTPLDVSLNNSITKGIVSAKRNRHGLEYYQTDASINPGNSGGPVFNTKGELIALAVAGIFTQTGASLNVNYLIPIDDAIEHLSILPNTVPRNVISDITGDETADKLMNVYDSIVDLFE